MRLFQANIYRNHKMIELLVQAEDSDQARHEIARTWQGWQLRELNNVFALPLIWKTSEWSTD